MARRSYAFEPAYRNLRLNQRIRTDVDARLVDAGTWNRGAIPVVEQNLIGKACTAGLDLSAKHDLTAFLLAFPASDGTFDIVCRFWTPQGKLAERRPGERELFEQWISAGYLISVPGEIIDPAWVLREISILAARFQLKAIRYDKSYMDGIRLEMAKANVTLPFVEHQQGFISMGPALQFLADKLRAGQVRHGGNPILTHCIGNAVTVADAADNLKFHKGRSHGTSKLRIDGAVALAMAMSPMSVEPPRDFKLFYI
jgi:phage terminase large subunit-like protein